MISWIVSSELGKIWKTFFSYSRNSLYVRKTPHFKNKVTGKPKNGFNFIYLKIYFNFKYLLAVLYLQVYFLEPCNLGELGGGLGRLSILIFLIKILRNSEHL